MNTQTTIAMIGNTARHAEVIARADWAPYVESAVRRFVTVCVAVYVAGYMAGAALHRLNDAMAAAWVALIVAPSPSDASSPDSPKVATPEAPTPVAPCVSPLATMRDDLMALSAAELRRLAGVRSKRYTKATLAEMVLTMA